MLLSKVIEMNVELVLQSGIDGSQCSILTLVHSPRTNKTLSWPSENALRLAPRLVSFVEKNIYYNFITWAVYL